MRIQHNIMAMNAYRNYNTNTKALSGNLEKLSSGYKINRAGDDAAGLAISEKMRAQITGLDAAQKNVKDGISLVKTAEGAMQEIQDMLNRMDYLATQSANGTYDNEVDRYNLQKEVDQLKSEINRIADSANFNGIKLLDGSLDGAAKAAVAEKVKAVNVPDVGSNLGVDTILHKEADPPVDHGTTFSVDLHDISFENGATTNVMTLNVGGTEITLTGIASKAALDGAGIVTALTGSSTSSDVTVGNVTYPGGSDKPTVTIKGQKFELSGDGSRLTFTQVARPTKESEEVSGNMSVKITGAQKAAVESSTGAAPTTPVTVGTDATADVSTLNLSAIKDAADAINAGTGTISIKANDTNDGLDLLVNGKKVGTSSSTWTDISAAAGAAVNFVGLDGTTSLGKVTIKPGGTTDTTVDLAKFNTAVDTTVAYTAGTPADPDSVSGDWNVQTTAVQDVKVAGNARLASTVYKLDESMVVDGNSIVIGNTDYTFTTNADEKDTEGKVYIGDMVGEGKKIDMEEVAKRISYSARNNEMWTVSAHADKKGLTLVEKDGGNALAKTKNKIDLTTKEGIAATLGYKTAAKEAVDADDSKSLTLQIGDTSDSYNQLSVKVGDMHTDAMGIADIDIGNQKGAQDAVQVIKDAINYVSGIRGDLGAIQNRLEHTGNNLSVMAENIQDAESTIRDTDVANEMMSYVKNNILVQSAQAMLAQANQVPQGVLQLLG